MNCEKIKELLMTDYIDGELEAALMKEVDAHIKKCGACRLLKAELEDKITVPLRQSGLVEPPQDLWSRIKGEIEEGSAEKPVPAVRIRLRDIFTVKRPVFAVAAVMVILLTAGIFTKSHFMRKEMLTAYFEEQMEFIDSLNNGDNGFYESIDSSPDDFFL